MIKLPTDSYGNTGWAVRARQTHHCEANWTYRGCTKVIQPGEHYYRAIAWPGSDANEDKAPWVMRICRNCLNDELRPKFDLAVSSRKDTP